MQHFAKPVILLVFERKITEKVQQECQLSILVSLDRGKYCIVHTGLGYASIGFEYVKLLTFPVSYHHQIYQAEH